MRYRWTSAGVTLLLAVIFMTVLCLSPAAAEPDPPSAWRMVGQIGGPTQAVAVQGHYAYVGVGLRLVVLDVSDPATPTEVGSTTPFPYFVEDIVVSGTLAYVAAGGAGLRVVDVSDPADPIELGAWDSPGYAEGVAVSGKIVYLADGAYGLRTVDVSAPRKPDPLGAAYDMNYAYDVAVSGGVACIASAGAGLLVVDVRDPYHPVERMVLDTPGNAYGVAISGTTAIVADGWEGLDLIDIADPANPQRITVLKTPGWAFDVAVAGSHAFVADAFNGLQVVELSNSSQPVLLGASSAENEHAGSVVVSGKVALLADRNWGLRVVSVADPSHPTQVGLYDPLSYADGVWIDGDHAYIAAGKYGLRVVDIADQLHPVQVGRYATTAFATSVVVSADYAFVAAAGGEGDGLHVVDVSDPTHPHGVGFSRQTDIGAYSDVALVGGVAYLADEWGLEIVSVSDPFHPTLIGILQLCEWSGAPDTTGGVAVGGTLAYLASSFAGLEVVDVSNPISPALIGGYNSGESFAQDVAVSGNKVYIADYFGLRIVNVSDPTNPTELGFYDTPGEAEGVVVSGTLAYVADGDRGVSVIDVSNPFSPTLTGAFNTPGYAQEVAVVGNRIFVADGPNGLLILEPTLGSSAHSAAAGLAQTQGTSSTLETYLQAAAQRPLNPVGSAAGVSPGGSATSAPADVPANRTSSGTEAHALTIGSTCGVTSAADSGPGSLRECLENASSGALVTFDPLVFLPTHPVTIALLTGLPPLGDGYVTIDASNAGVILDGNATPAVTHGLVISSDGNVIQGLQVVSFPGLGMFVTGNRNCIGGDRFIGSGPLGQGNLLSGNANSGLAFGEAMSNTVSGNLVGTDVHGTAAWGNGGFAGIMLGGEGNIIGGTAPGERNIVSGNLGNGIGTGGHVHGNRVIGNYVGTDISGSFDLGNRGHGIGLEVNSWNNWIEGNLSSGNVRAGLLADGGDYNTFVGNRVGTDATGTNAIPNDWCGVYVGSVSFTRVGGTRPGEGNLVSGGPCGIEVGGPGGNVGNLVLGNLVGTDSSGTLPLGNGSGVTLGAKGGRVILGGATTAERNVISGTGCPDHWAMGVDVSGDYHFVAGNYIGTDISGTAPLGNCGDGIWMHGAEHCVIQGNVIAHNTGSGAYVESYAFNTLRRNRIYDHPSPGILLGGGITSLPAPVILTATEARVSGTACPGCAVEVFSDEEDEGRVYEGSAIASTTGAFTFTKPDGLTGPYVTATATDSAGNTSEFSLRAPVWYFRLWLPAILTLH